MWYLKDETKGLKKSLEVPQREVMKDSFSTVNSYKKKTYHGSHKNIKITGHSMDRAYQRLSISSKEEVRKFASDAKNKGINLNSIREDTYRRVGLNRDEFEYLNKSFKAMNGANLYLWKGCIFVFCGKGGNTLKTIINLKVDKEEEIVNEVNLFKLEGDSWDYMI